MKVERPTIEDLLPEAHLRSAFDDKSAAFEAGRLVRGLRTTAGLTQNQLAQRLRVSQARISAIENGDGPDGPTYGVLRRIVIACGYRWSPNFVRGFVAEEASSQVQPAQAAQIASEA